MTRATTRIYVLVLNALTAVAGLVLLGLGVYTLIKADVLLYSKAIPITLIVAGGLTFLVSFVGCFGAASESRPILYSYFAVLLLLVITQAILGIVTIVNQDKIDNFLDSAWQDAYDRHPRVIRDIQNEFSCCGFRKPTDRSVPKTKPDSCQNSPYFGYDTPCFESLKEAYSSYQTALWIVGIFALLVQIGALVATWLLIDRIPTEEELERGYRSEHARLVGGTRRRDQEQGTSTGLYGST